MVRVPAAITGSSGGEGPEYGAVIGRSRGGLTRKIHAVVATNGLTVRLGLTAGKAHDSRLALKLLSRLAEPSSYRLGRVDRPHETRPRALFGNIGLMAAIHNP